MPKSKPRKAVLKRIRVTRNGKVLAKAPGSRHLLSSKSGKRRRQMRRTGTVNKCERKRIMRLIKGHG